MLFSLFVMFHIVSPEVLVRDLYLTSSTHEICLSQEWERWRLSYGGGVLFKHLITLLFFKIYNTCSSKRKDIDTGLADLSKNEPRYTLFTEQTALCRAVSVCLNEDSLNLQSRTLRSRHDRILDVISALKLLPDFVPAKLLNLCNSTSKEL